MTPAESKANREKRRLRGVCAQCGGPPTPRGRVCDRCRTKKREWEAASRRAAGIKPRAPKAECSKDGCSKVSRSKGLCMNHYKASWLAQKRAEAALLCECGSPIVDAGMCAKCAWMDGRVPYEAEVIAVLRGGPCELEAVASSIGCGITTVRNAFRAMRKSGRVVLVTDENDSGISALYGLNDRVPAQVSP